MLVFAGNKDVVDDYRVIGIVSDCAAVSSLNDSATCPDQCSGVPVSSEELGNVESVSLSSSSADTAAACLPVDGDTTTADRQSLATSVSTVSKTAADAAIEHTDEQGEAATDTDLAALASAADSQNVYHVKWIKFRGSQTPIVMQNQNGPCPLLAIVNVLLLQGKIKLSSSSDLVASDQLMAYIADWIFDNVPKVCKL